MSGEELRALHRRWLPDLWHSEREAMPGLTSEIFTSDAVAHRREEEDHQGPAAIAARVREGVPASPGTPAGTAVWISCGLAVTESPSTGRSGTT